MGGKRTIIAIDDLAHFQIDSDKQLYWDGEAVVTMTKFSLPWWINASVVATGISAVLAVILDLLGKLHYFG